MSKQTPTLDPEDIAREESDTPEVVDLDQPVDTPEPKSPPAPKPGDPDYDWAPHYEGAELYVHTYPDGQVVALRQFKDIYSKQWLRSIRDLATDFDVESAAVDRAACETAREVIDNRPAPIGGPDDFDVLFKAWSGGVTPGE